MRNSELDSDLSNIDISDIRETSRPSRSGQGAGRRRRRRKKRRRVLSKLLPPLIAIALIAVVVVVAMKTGLFESFSYSTKEADLFEYFGITGTDEAVLIVDGEPTEGRMRVINGTLYMPLSDIKALYTDRFYYEIAENRLLYTMEQETYSTVVGEASYNNASGTVTTDYIPVIEESGEEESVMYMALDYLKLFKNISVRLFGGGNEPYRAEIKTEWGLRKPPPKASMATTYMARKMPMVMLIRRMVSVMGSRFFAAAGFLSESTLMPPPFRRQSKRRARSVCFSRSRTRPSPRASPGPPAG